MFDGLAASADALNSQSADTAIGVDDAAGFDEAAGFDRINQSHLIEDSPPCRACPASYPAKSDLDCHQRIR